MASDPTVLCPSAHPDMAGARVFAVVGGSVDAPRADYLEHAVPLTPEIRALAGPVDPAEVLFRGSSAWVDGPVRYRLQDVEAPEPYLISVAWAGLPSGGAWGVRAGRARRRPAVRRS